MNYALYHFYVDIEADIGHVGRSGQQAPEHRPAPSYRLLCCLGEESALTGILHRARSRGSRPQRSKKRRPWSRSFLLTPYQLNGRANTRPTLGSTGSSKAPGPIATAHRDATTVLVAYRHGLHPVGLVT